MNDPARRAGSRPTNRRSTIAQASRVFLWLLAPALLGCGHATAPSASKPDDVAVFTVYPDQPRQTISQIGSGNFNHRFGQSTSATEPVSELNIAVFQPRFARVAMDIGNWEPVNDNADALEADPSAFVDDRYNHATFEFMQQFQAQGVEFIASVFYVPDWMVENPEDNSQRIIFPTMYPEAIESIAAWLVHAKESYGVEVSYCSFNEANLGFYQLLSSDDYIQMIRLGGQRFAELGLKTKWLLGDCYQIGGCVDYAEPIWETDDIRPYLGPFAFHNYDADTNTDENLTALGDWAADQGLDIRVTEAGWDGDLMRRPKILATWENARQLMLSFNRTLKTTKATTFYYHEMMGRDYALNDGSQPYPSMEMLRQLNEAFPPGAQIVGTSDNTNDIVLVAARTPDGGFGVHLVNVSLAKDDAPDEVRIDGLPEGEYQLHLSVDGNLDQLAQSITARAGSLNFALPDSSVGYLVKTK
jgi:hypothetical protein